MGPPGVLYILPPKDVVLLLLLRLPACIEARFTDDMPISARLAPDDERWKSGWFGRDPSASECLDPDTERTWLALLVLDRFMADGGGGMPELMLMPPRVWGWDYDG